MGIVRWILNWFYGLPWNIWRIAVTVESADEIPDEIGRSRAVLVGTIRAPKWLAFDCPCGTGHRIMVNLDKNRNPHWSIVNPDRLTVRPSVDYRGSDRRCHYLIRDGRVIWVRD